LSLSCVVEGLYNGREYTVTVTASNDAGLTSASSEAVTATPAKTPGPVDQVTVRIKGSGSKRTAVITWSPPTDDGGAAVDGYRTRWKKGSSSYRSWSQTTTGTVKFRVRKGATYRVQIAAHNAAGYGTSKTVRVRF
ncbi:MAG: fibronectin type III domain-containing protein, partial [Candidatus Nanopelagicales bacterium]